MLQIKQKRTKIAELTVSKQPHAIAYSPLN
jgi:hypothetical protein